MTGNPRLSVLVPVFNEVATVRTLLERVRAVRYPKEIIVVDDCSKDGTRAVLEEFQRTTPDTPENRLVLVMHEKNQGKGAAIRTAAQHR
jgi:glycosyltransferase involved in cell wall biosynthesis